MKGSLRLLGGMVALLLITACAKRYDIPRSDGGNAAGCYVIHAVTDSTYPYWFPDTIGLISIPDSDGGGIGFGTRIYPNLSIAWLRTGRDSLSIVTSRDSSRADFNGRLTTDGFEGTVTSKQDTAVDRAWRHKLTATRAQCLGF